MRSNRRWISMIIAIVLIFAFTVGTSFFDNKAVIEAQGVKEKQFTSIQVKKGDTLWTIAKDHMGKEYPSIDEYIEEVCQTNHICDGKITEDMYLVIPYYRTK